MPRGKYFTPTDDELIISMWGNNMSQGDIAKALGVTNNTIAGRVCRLRAKGADIPRRQGGDPKKKQHARRARTEMHNARLHPDVQRARDKLLSKQVQAREAHKFKLPPDAKPKTEVRRLPPTTKNRVVKRTPMTASFGRMNLKEGPTGLPKSGNLTAIKAVEGTTCTTKFLDLKPKQCRYVHGHGEGKLFCDDQAEMGLSYCLAHYDFCHQVGSALGFDKARRRVAT